MYPCTARRSRLIRQGTRYPDGNQWNLIGTTFGANILIKKVPNFLLYSTRSELPRQNHTLKTCLADTLHSHLTALLTGSPWPEEEAAVALSCPWARQPDVLAALESTGGRGEDAIELLIAARNEPGLEGKVNGVGDTAVETEGTGKANTNSGGDGSVLDTLLQGSGATDEGRGHNGAAGLATEGGKKKKGDKAAKKVTRSADCPCGSGVKYKKCCRKKDAAIARGQIAPPAEPESTSGDSSVVDDLGSLVI